MGETLAQAQSKMDAVAARIAAENPARNGGWGVRLEPMHEALVGWVRQPLAVLLGAVAFVLIIACANVANLMLSHAAARQTETAIRAAMGASRGRLIRQLLTESVLLGVFGSLVGLLVAAWTVPLLVTLSPVEIPRRDEIGLSGAVLAATGLLSVLTGLLFGLAPALLASRTDVNASLKSSGQRASGSAGARRLREVLAAAQVGVALTLLIGAGLMIHTFLRLQGSNLGFDPDSVLTFQVRLSRQQYSQDKPMDAHGMNWVELSPRIAELFEQTVERLRRIPGVASASAITWLPINAFWSEWRGFAIEGRPRPAEGQRQPGGGYNPVSTDFFRTMRIDLVRGRDFNQFDTVSAPWIAIVNEAAARTFWKNEDPIGQRITLDIDETPRQIVGIVKDVKHYAIRESANPQVYVPHVQQPVRYWANRSRGRLHMSFIVRAEGKSPDWGAAFSQAVAEVDKTMPVYAVKPMREYVTANAGDTRLYMVPLSVFAGVALLLAAIGVYGVVSYSATQRTHEIGVRMALGARQWDAVRLVVVQGAKLAAAGLALGLALSFALTRVLKSQLYGMTATDPATFISISLVLVVIALAASYVPARRASRIDPAVALRHE